jgi:hypothetical protein
MPTIIQTTALPTVPIHGYKRKTSSSLKLLIPTKKPMDEIKKDKSPNTPTSIAPLPLLLYEIYMPIIKAAKEHKKRPDDISPLFECFLSVNLYFLPKNKKFIISTNLYKSFRPDIPA